MKINIICDEAEGGWIYSEFIYYIKKYSKNDIVVNKGISDEVDVVHYIPYYNYKKTSKPSTCWLSHQEEKEPLKTKFFSAAKGVDVGLSHSKKYANILRDEHGCNNIMSIQPGVDLKKFKLRSGARSANKKLIVGHVGRRYSSSNRKNPRLIDMISKLSFVSFNATDGKLKDKDVPGFIQKCDVIISPALIEGGPMCISQSLASGVPIVCFAGVGVADEFDTGVLKAKDEVEFLHILSEMYKNKDHINKWRSKELMSKMREQVENITYKKFVEEHDKVWEMINTPSWKKSK